MLLHEARGRQSTSVATSPGKANLHRDFVQHQAQRLAAEAPGLRMVDLWPERSNTVDSALMKAEPPSRTNSARSPRSSSTCCAVLGLT